MSFASVLNQFKKPRRRSRSSAGSSLVDNDNNSAQLTNSLDIIGKNSMALPIMMRDINVMKQGILKLVKASGGTQRDKADRFFLSASDREKSYESQLSSKKSTSPTKVGEKKDGKGFFGQANSFLNSMIAGGISNMLIKGGLIAGILYGIGKFFTSSEFRTSVGDMIGNFGKTVFGEEGWKDVKKSITTGALILLGGIVAIKSSLMLLSSIIASAAVSMGGGLGLGGARGRGRRARVGPGNLMGLATIAAGSSFAVNRLMDSNDGNMSSVDQKMSTVDKVGAGLGIATAGGLVASGVSSAMSAAKSTGTSILDARTQSLGQLEKATPTTKWGKFLKFVERKSPRLWKKIGLKLSQAGTLALIPIGGWIMAAVKLGFAIWTVWELYELWKEFNNIPDEAANSPVKKSESDAAEPAFNPINLFKEMISQPGINLGVDRPDYYGNAGVSPSQVPSSGGVGMALPKGVSINSKSAIDYLVSKGLTPAQAAGVVGNLIQESTLNSGAFNKSEGAYGLAQWRGSRLQDLQQFASSRGKDISDVNTQLDFIMHELGGKERRAGAMLASSKTAEEAAFNFGKYYERPKVVEQSRMQYANTALKEYGTGTPVATSTVSSKSAFEGVKSPFAKTGSQLNQASGVFLNSRNGVSGPPVVIDASTNVSNNGGGSKGSINLPSSGVIDTEFAKLLVEKSVG
jgi:hypothetical protein